MATKTMPDTTIWRSWCNTYSYSN